MSTLTETDEYHIVDTRDLDECDSECDSGQEECDSPYEYDNAYDNPEDYNEQDSESGTSTPIHAGGSQIVTHNDSFDSGTSSDEESEYEAKDSEERCYYRTVQVKSAEQQKIENEECESLTVLIILLIVLICIAIFWLHLMRLL
jgi:cobalamin biosynthesis Mg chelatase CobN